MLASTSEEDINTYFLLYAMNKFLVIVLVSIISITNIHAQKHEYYDTKHEVGVTVGVDALSQVVSAIADFTSILVSAAATTAVTGGYYTGHYSYGDKSFSPAISVEYYYHVNNIIGLGGFLGYNSLKRDMYAEWTNNSDGTHRKELTGKASRYNVSLIPGAKFDWVRKKHFGFYSKFALGVTLMFEKQKDDDSKGTDYKDTVVIPNGQLSLVGLEAGSIHLRGYMELGFGEQGLLLAGVKYKF